MSVRHAMKPTSEAHFAILRRHMVEVIRIQVDLASEELGKAALDERVLAAMRKVQASAGTARGAARSATRC